MKNFLLLALSLLLLTGCDNKDSDAEVVAVPVKVPVAVESQPELPKKDFIGTWNGADGAIMIVEAGRVKINDGSGEKTYENATITDRSIVFNRDGTIITARAGNGDDTGVPSFAGKADCIVIKHGEGYCRD